MKEDNKKKKNSGVGFYIALCCCVAAIGIVGFVNSQNEEVPTEDTLPVPTENSLKVPIITLSPESDGGEETVDAVAEITENEPIIVTSDLKPDISNESTDVIETGENVDFYDGDVVESISLLDTPEFVMPVEGEICHKFSGDQLYYDSTLGDYRTHDGIDIKADMDTDVVASLDGIIEEVYTDTLGKTVIINHNNGYKTKYANLDDIENLKPGMELSKGDFIAHVGNYAYGEKTTEPHIHFEIIRDDIYLDPEAYIK